MSNPAHAPEALRAKPFPKWDDQDASILRTFVETNPKFLQYLAHKTPAIEKGSMEIVAISALKHAGYEELIAVIASMMTRQPKEPESPFITGDGEDQT